jgi:hypothetical protein
MRALARAPCAYPRIAMPSTRDHLRAIGSRRARARPPARACTRAPAHARLHTRACTRARPRRRRRSAPHRPVRWWQYRRLRRLRLRLRRRRRRRRRRRAGRGAGCRRHCRRHEKREHPARPGPHHLHDCAPARRTCIAAGTTSRQPRAAPRVRASAPSTALITAPRALYGPHAGGTQATDPLWRRHLLHWLDARLHKPLASPGAFTSRSAAVCLICRRL